MGKEGKCLVLTMDVEAVKVSPWITASSFFFKTKLSCHNFTIYDLVTKHVVCYWFTTTTIYTRLHIYIYIYIFTMVTNAVKFQTHQAKLASVAPFLDYVAPVPRSLLPRHFRRAGWLCIFISHSHNKYLDKYCKKPYPDPIILWSDRCLYQSRNVNLFNALSAYAVENNVEILQKYLVVGHTQMECDSVHARLKPTFKGRDYKDVKKETIPLCSWAPIVFWFQRLYSKKLWKACVNKARSN